MPCYQSSNNFVPDARTSKTPCSSARIRQWKERALSSLQETGQACKIEETRQGPTQEGAGEKSQGQSQEEVNWVAVIKFTQGALEVLQGHKCLQSFELRGEESDCISGNHSFMSLFSYACLQQRLQLVSSRLWAGFRYLCLLKRLDQVRTYRLTP